MPLLSIIGYHRYIITNTNLLYIIDRQAWYKALTYLNNNLTTNTLTYLNNNLTTNLTLTYLNNNLTTNLTRSC
jgi:hypothetical protein